MLLDEIIFPRYRRVTIREPVFIVGVPRSGSTFLQRLLARDGDHFTSFSTWEILAAPSITHRKILHGLGVVDAALGGWARKVIGALDKKACEELAPYHEAGLFLHEEDYLILGHIASTLAGVFLFPFFEEFYSYSRFDQEVEDRKKRRVMAFYRKCVQRHMYHHGESKLFLSKNPAFTGSIRTIKETFPDARIICTVRNPLQAVPSAMSFLSFWFHRFADPPEEYPLAEQEIALLEHYAHYPLECEELFAKGDWLFLRYDDLVKNAHSAVLGVYEAFGISPGSGFEGVLLDLSERSRSRESEHQYSLDQFGLTEERVVEMFGRTFDRFGFDRG